VRASKARIIGAGLAVFVLLGSLFGVIFAAGVDTDGLIHWEIDLSCKHPDRTLVGFEVQTTVTHPNGSEEILSNFFEVSNPAAVLDTVQIDISDEEGNRAVSVTRLVETTAEGDSIWGAWNLLSEEVSYEAPSGGCFANRYLGW